MAFGSPPLFGPVMKDDRTQIYRALSLVGQLGWWVVSLILAGFALGYLLDQRFNTKGLLLIPCLLLGIAAGFWKAYHLIMKHVR